MNAEKIRERIITEKLAGNSELYVIHHPTLGDILIKPIPFKIFSELRDLVVRGVITNVELEDIVFRSYVLNEDILNLSPDLLAAGDVATIAQQILAVSAPNSPEEMQNKINYYMGIATSDIMDKMMEIICMAFPYTPDQLEEMTWTHLARLLAKAQVILLQRGMMKEPLQIYDKRKGLPGKKQQRKRHSVLGSQMPPMDRMPGKRENIERVRRIKEQQKWQRIRKESS